jgi:hypothetical protein
VSSGHSLPLRYLTLLGAAGVVACGDNHPTAPHALPPDPTAFSLTAKDSAAFLSAVKDIQLRIVPALTASDDATSLRTALTRVGEAVATRDRAALEDAVAMSEHALASIAGASDDDVGESADLDAVRLVLIQAKALSSAPSVIVRDATP